MYQDIGVFNSEGLSASLFDVQFMHNRQDKWPMVAGPMEKCAFKICLGIDIIKFKIKNVGKEIQSHIAQD